MPTREPGATASSRRAELRPCVRCRKPTHPSRAVYGYGPDCARLLGLVGSTTDTGQDGTDLLDLLAEQAETA